MEEIEAAVCAPADEISSAARLTIPSREIIRLALYASDGSKVRLKSDARHEGSLRVTAKFALVGLLMMRFGTNSPPQLDTGELRRAVRPDTCH